MIKVKHVRHMPAGESRYIGRACREFTASPYANPFHIGKDGDRSEVILKFAILWYSEKYRALRQKALTEIPEDAWLSCWCAPQACHGDIIAGYLNWKRKPQTLF